MTVIFWFTLDLRLTDHPGLAAAFRDFETVIPVLVLDKRDPWFFGGASQWWLHHSIAKLQHAIQLQGGSLVLKTGNTEEVLAQLCQTTKAAAVYCSRAYEPWLADLQYTVNAKLQKQDLSCKRFSGRLLYEPELILNQQGKPFQVFTPYYKHSLKQFDNHQPLTMPPSRWHSKRVQSETLKSWQLLPQKPNWAEPFTQLWSPGEAGAHAQLTLSVEDTVADYAQQRDIPGVAGTSNLSPHLHFGEISPRQVWHQVRTTSRLTAEAREPFLRQLVWREFSHYLLHYWPTFPSEPFKANFVHFPWRKSKAQLTAWQQGTTGYPIVDAGMRQLWQTGWMHNRVRMIVASFLCKHLRLSWQLGAKWFWDTLLDADLANNSAGWQWVAGCGADAAPYFRIFNPILQGEKFDSQGQYIRTWVPELRNLPNKFIHQPWSAPAEILTKANITLGKDYPHPIVDHQQARQDALSAYAHMKQKNEER